MRWKVEMGVMQACDKPAQRLNRPASEYPTSTLYVGGSVSSDSARGMTWLMRVSNVFWAPSPKLGPLAKNARSAPGREVLFPQVNADIHQADTFRYLNGRVVGHVTQEVDNRSSSYRGHLCVNRKSGDDRFSRRGVGGRVAVLAVGCVSGMSAHATH